MINVVGMALQSNSFAERCNRERMKLAFALFDVEIAHSRFAILDPGDEDHKRCLDDLKSALAKYWQIDNEVQRYLQSGGRSQTMRIDTQLEQPVDSHFLTELASIPHADRIGTTGRQNLRLGRASTLWGAIGRVIERVGRKVN